MYSESPVFDAIKFDAIKQIFRDSGRTICRKSRSVLEAVIMHLMPLHFESNKRHYKSLSEAGWVIFIDLVFAFIVISPLIFDLG
jgi:hypothetical protein